MVLLLKVIASYVVLAALYSVTTFGSGIQFSDDCLLRICRGAASSGNNSSQKVSSQDESNVNALLKPEVISVNALLDLHIQDEYLTGGNFQCSSADVLYYSKLIGCKCHNGTSCRVTSIDFSERNLKGRLPEAIGNLTDLETLDLGSNKLSGLIPKSLVNLKRLSYLNLCENNLEGPIPLFNGDNKELKSLSLCLNWLNGSVPKGLGELPSLRILNIWSNVLSGAIPNEIWNLTTLEGLYFSENDQLEGVLTQLGNLKSIQALHLYNNNFSGELPKSIGGLQNLSSLAIQGNNFNGTIPDVIGQLPKLEILILVGNNFKGPLPKAFSSRSLSELIIADVSEDEKGNPFPDLRSSTNLTYLSLRNCSLTGPIPDEIWHLQQLFHLDLSFNKLSGEIPLSLNQNFSYIYIFLRSNKLNGSLPGWTSNWTGVYVDVSENRFTNYATTFLNDTISNRKNLFACCTNTSSDAREKWLDVNYRCANDTPTYDYLYINCGGNETNIGPNHYEADLDPYGTSTFVLSNNSAWGYSSTGSFLFAADDKYIFEETCNITMVDAPLYTGARVAPVSLKYYGFCLRNGNYTVRLHFAEIGWDPAKYINNKQGRRVFNVEIQGKKELEDFNIEEAAGGLRKDVVKNFTANVTNNRLEIHLYWSGKGSMLVSEYYGPLISAISVFAVPEGQHKRLSAVSIGAIVGSSFVFVGFIVAMFWMYLGGKKPKKDGVELYPGGVFNFQEIKTATNNFDVKKKIGETGFVYQGVLPDGVEVAVKQLSVKSKQEAHQIINEIGIIYTLQHPNIAKPMGCCFKETQVLLVYKYMENLSLHHALFGSDDDVKSKLTWRTRFKICVGIAKGLAFLHEESKLDIIHSNIKPTNILLDQDFNVKISDFRYSELHDGQLINKQDTTFRNMPRAKDTGHMAPEYMQGLPLTPKADVYSFGLVILEIISGQPHIINKPKEDILLLNTAYKYHEQGILEALIDTSLHEHKDYKYSEAVSILHLAMQCVSPSFDLRPTMSEVVQILEGKKKFKGKRINPSPIVDSILIPSQSSTSESTFQEESSIANVSDSQNRETEESTRHISTD